MTIRIVDPPLELEVRRRPLYRRPELPLGEHGFLLLQGRTYAVRPLGSDVLGGFRFYRLWDGAHFDVETHTGAAFCDCMASRDRPCEHARALVEMRRMGVI